MIKKILQEPIKALYYVVSKINKNYLYKRYSRLSKSRGIDKIYFILSFDCDSHEDAKYALEVQNKLLGMGIIPIYAVPGQMLEKNESIYKEISQMGSSFMNHGYYEHVYFDNNAGDYRSNFFYDELPLSKIEEDISLGDKTVTKVIGKKPIGFRAPHFGVFQKKSELKFITDILNKLKYKYASSTIPYYAFRYGSMFEHNNIKEFPVTGMLDNPMAILDSWGYFRAPDRIKNKEDYSKDILALVEYYKQNNINGIINLYADILHIHDSPEFFEAMKILSDQCINITYEELIK